MKKNYKFVHFDRETGGILNWFDLTPVAFFDTSDPDPFKHTARAVEDVNQNFEKGVKVWRKYEYSRVPPSKELLPVCDEEWDSRHECVFEVSPPNSRDGRLTRQTGNSDGGMER